MTTRKKKHTGKKQLGNPALIAAATNPQLSNSIGKGIKTGLGIAGVAALIIGGRIVYKRWRRSSLLKKAGSDPEIQAVVDIYDAIPAGLKQGQGSLFNPFGFISDLTNKIETIWKKTDTDRIIGVGQRIYEKKLDVDKIYKYFQVIYGESLAMLLNKALTPEELQQFRNQAESGSVSTTPKVTDNKVAIVKESKGLRVRTEPMAKKNFVGKETNVLFSVPFNKIAGITSGVETYDKENNVVFIELKMLDSKLKWHTVYAWKGGFNFKPVGDQYPVKSWYKPDPKEFEKKKSLFGIEEEEIQEYGIN